MGSTSRLASREQQACLFELGGILHTEAMSVQKTNISCLDQARLHNYLQDILQDPETGGNVYCTVAGLLLFGINPRKYLKQAGLRVSAFSSEDKEYQALLDEILDGPMVGRWSIEAREKGLLDGGIIERFMESISPFISQQAGDIDTNLRRDTCWFYPLETICEVLINALAHRDWTQFREIAVGSYSNRFEVISPSALPNSMSIEKMKAGQRSSCNTIIMEVLQDYDYVDHRGMGIRRKTIPLTKKLTGKEPEFIASDDGLKTILYR